jgi:nucleoid-associated protein YejK
MFDRYELEDAGKRESEEYEAKAKSFGMLHGMSSLANLVRRRRQRDGGSGNDVFGRWRRR